MRPFDSILVALSVSVAPSTPSGASVAHAVHRSAVAKALRANLAPSWRIALGEDVARSATKV